MTWSDFFLRVVPVLDGSKLFESPSGRARWASFPTPPQIEMLSELTSTLMGCTSTPTERLFLEQYIAAFKADYEIETLPALVPQAWVNWLHYRPDDSERARAIQTQPMRADFIAFYKGRKLVLEIDGWSHISDNFFSVDGNGRPAEGPSMRKYTEHLKKDRWLRRQGWEVHRFTNVEVEKDGAETLLGEVGFEFALF